MKDINPKHKVFADEYIITTDPIGSYQKAYPKASSESARVKSYSLLQNVTIAEYIAESKDKIKNARENSLIETLKKQDSSNILTREKYIASLTKDILDIEAIIERGYLIKKVNIDGKVEMVKEVFKTREFSEWHRTLEIKRENIKKIEGWDAPKQIEQNTTVELKDKPKVEDWILSKSNKIK